jgi:septal ring factor EnvC (AmiA/AmiB activator)
MTSYLRLLGLLICLSVLPPAGADSDAQLRLESRKLRQIRAQIEQIQADLAKREEQRDELQAQLRDTEKQLSAVSRKIRDLDGRIGNGKRQLDKLYGEERQLEAGMSRHRSILAGQLRSAFMAGQQERIKLMLNQQDPAALSRMINYYGYLNDARLQSIETARQTLRELARVKAGIEDRSRELKGLRAEHEKQYNTQAAQRRERARLLGQISDQIRAQEQAVSRLRADQDRVEELIASLKGIFSDIPVQPRSLADFRSQKGALPWPARGAHLNRFGQPRAGKDLLWRGVRIAAAAGSGVQAVSHGRVAFADWLPGLGLMIIIDHGHGYMSLYGNNQALFKETGDWVNPGEMIATVGDSGGETQTALYFEVRHQGQPLNPADWCKG